MQSGALLNCISHDLYGGAVRQDLSLILKTIARQNLISWSEIQKSFSKMRTTLKGYDKTNWFTKLPPLERFKSLRGNHSSIHRVAIFLGLMMSHLPSGHPLFESTSWKLYLRLKYVCELMTKKTLESEVIFFNTLLFKSSVQLNVKRYRLLTYS